jgi:hypothetical protein
VIRRRSEASSSDNLPRLRIDDVEPGGSVSNLQQATACVGGSDAFTVAAGVAGGFPESADNLDILGVRIDQRQFARTAARHHYPAQRRRETEVVETYPLTADRRREKAVATAPVEQSQTESAGTSSHSTVRRLQRPSSSRR